MHHLVGIVSVRRLISRLYQSRQSDGSPSQWTSSSVSPKTLTRIMVFSCS
uniref:Uncharacterized protein n=1 Tax=Hyaloperonospora arabidopsidis (strain Emoy2) TaxID=559515 RepID=M4BML7_HYAAE